MLLTHERCHSCGQVTSHFNGNCGRCAAEYERLKRADHFDALRRLTIEQRVARIEEWIYESANQQPLTDG